MSRIAYVNGRYVRHAEAAVSIDERGLLFADAVYEVIEVHAGAFVDEAGHLARLARSRGELAMASPLGDAALALVLREIVTRNRLRDGFVYLQIGRGVAPRDHVFPDPPARPSLVVTARAVDPAKGAAKAAAGIRVVTLPDQRWARPDIKSTSLLPNVLAKQAAKERGASEAWLVGADGRIREGASTNAWIVAADGRVLTHPADGAILRGITRTTLLGVLAAQGLRLEERGFSLDEAYAAREAFVTGATTLVTPVIAIDDRQVGDGVPGPVVAALRIGFRGRRTDMGAGRAVSPKRVRLPTRTGATPIVGTFALAGDTSLPLEVELPL